VAPEDNSMAVLIVRDGFLFAPTRPTSTSSIRMAPDPADRDKTMGWALMFTQWATSMAMPYLRPG
jgi:hypothetical protein